MSLCRDIQSLQPMLAKKCEELLKICEEKGIKVRINETYRDPLTQIIYYLQGRIDIKNNPNIVNEFNRLRKKYGFWEVSASEALYKKITWTFESKHLEGKAFDVVMQKDGKDWWNAPPEAWAQIGIIGESLGLTWGGRWIQQDLPHFEID